MNFAAALKVADAVLYEGYALYPYRSSSLKNQVRWQFGVVAPRRFSEATGLDQWQQQTECLLEPLRAESLVVRVRCLQLQSRRVERLQDAAFVEADRLAVDGAEYIPWEEGIAVEKDEIFVLGDLLAGECSVQVTLQDAIEYEALTDWRGDVAGRYVRERTGVAARLTAQAWRIEAASPLLKLRLRLENLTVWGEPDSSREDSLRHSLIAAHLLVGAPGGEFLSMADPPEWARHQASECDNRNSWPVLAAEAGERDLLLSSPIILYDYPQIAPESQSDFFDGTEIDELLSLRTATLTDEEKREARATDPRVAALLDQVETLPPELMDRLHGAIRYLRQISPEPIESDEPVATDQTLVGGVSVRPGDTVRIKSGLKRSDAQDLFLAGRDARVEKLLQDAEGRTYLALTIPDDPATETFLMHGRYLYFDPDEVEALEAAQ